MLCFSFGWPSETCHLPGTRKCSAWVVLEDATGHTVNIAHRCLLPRLLVVWMTTAQCRVDGSSVSPTLTSISHMNPDCVDHSSFQRKSLYLSFQAFVITFMRQIRVFVRAFIKCHPTEFSRKMSWLGLLFFKVIVLIGWNIDQILPTLFY